jgi:hypothetical protein
VFIDVGGGAGRVCLAIARQCREVINVDSSAAMRQEFEESEADGKINNARFVQSDWLEAEGIHGDVCLTANVTYTVREIVPFIERMEAAASRRVMITVWSTPPPNIDAAVFRLVFGEEQVAAPGHRELLPVLWEMGILPDVHVLPGGWVDLVTRSGSREEAITSIADRLWPDNPGHARSHRGQFRHVVRQGGRRLPSPLAPARPGTAHHLGVWYARMTRAE